MTFDATPAQRTLVGRRDFVTALIRAWRAEEGSMPTREQVGVLFAQYALETGQGNFCWNFNLGNVKATEDDVKAGRPYMMLRGTWEIIGGKKVVFEPPHPATWFRAFASLDEGMAFFLGKLRKRFARAWPAVLAGKPEEFARLLKAQGYYTAPEDQYARGLRAHFDRIVASGEYEDAIRYLDEQPTLEALPEAPSEPGETDGGASRRAMLSDTLVDLARTPTDDDP